MITDSSEQYTSELPSVLYRAQNVRELDRLCIEEQGIPGFELMSRAGSAAVAVLRDRWPEAHRWVIFCGVGNNGGDGYVMAALAEKAGFEARVVQVGDSGKIHGDALTAMTSAQQAGATLEPFDQTQFYYGDVIVDALLGTGLKGTVRGEYLSAINTINQSDAPVLAVDIPSGLCSDTGSVLGKAVRADATVTFIGVKQGLLTGQAADQVGEVLFAGLGVSKAIFDQVSPSSTLMGAFQLREWLPPRSKLNHKGNHGRVLVIGGDHGMGGAASMAAEAAGRVGAGLISVLTRPEHVQPALMRRPECMIQGIHEGESIQTQLDQADVIVIGPGLGQSEWGVGLLKQALTADRSLVLDADALNLLAQWYEQKGYEQEGFNQEQIQHQLLPSKHRWILTPHPGEASRLLRKNTIDLSKDRFDTVTAIQQQYQATVVLKGAGTLVAESDGTVWVCHSGNPGMGSGGMGDVLSGVIGGLLAQGMSLGQSAAAGVWIHASAGDRAAETGGQRGLLATDLMPFLRLIVNDR